MKLFDTMRPMTTNDKKKFLLFPRWNKRTAKAGGRASVNRKFSRSLLAKLDAGAIPLKGRLDEEN